MKANTLTLDLIRLSLIEEMGIDEDKVIIYNQKFVIPPTSGLYIYVERKGSQREISSRNKMIVDALGNANENQDSNWIEDICVGIYSRDLEAEQRKEEAAMALHSIFSQQMQELNSFKIFREVNIIPIGEIEGAARLYRFDLEFKVQAWYSKVKVAQFLNAWNVEVIVEDGDPLLDVEFVIPDTDPTVYPKT